jgi:hypothetical protein
MRQRLTGSHRLQHIDEAIIRIAAMQARESRNPNRLQQAFSMAVQVQAGISSRRQRPSLSR